MRIFSFSVLYLHIFFQKMCFAYNFLAEDIFSHLFNANKILSLLISHIEFLPQKKFYSHYFSRSSNFEWKCSKNETFTKLFYN
jgi:hypothetical protein